MMAAMGTKKTNHGFTLVELLVAITIIGILMAIAIPAITGALSKAREASMRVEVETISQAIEAYKLKYGDYPPDFMNWNVVVGHYRKAFPDIDPTELLNLRELTHSGGLFNPTSMDRAEALVWALGGFSSDPQFPFTGPGGPLIYFGNGTPAERTPAYFTYSVDRDNVLLEMKPNRLDLASINENSPYPSTTNRRLTEDGDVFPIYRFRKEDRFQPYVYFDSRTYRDFSVLSGVVQFNGYARVVDGEPDGVRPLVSTTSTPERWISLGGMPSSLPPGPESAKRSLEVFQFVDNNTFQVIAPGLDGQFGRIFTTPSSQPIYYQYPSGKAIVANTAASSPGDMYDSTAGKFQDTSFSFATLLENFALDNLGSFTESTFENDLQD